MAGKAKRPAKAKEPRPKKVKLTGIVTTSPKPDTIPIETHVIDTYRPILASIPTRLGDMVGRERDWLWRGVLPRGVVCVLTGPQGVGKTAVLAAAAAQVTGSTPFGKQGERPGGNVLWFSIEDDPRSVQLPRLRSAGCDTMRIHCPDYDGNGKLKRRTSIPSDSVALGDMAFGVGASLIVFDPLTSFLSAGMSPTDPLQVRAVMDSLSTVVADLNICCLVTLHNRKNRSGDPLEWISGCATWSQAARQVVLCDHHPDVRGEYLLTVLKPCSSIRARPWHYRLDKTTGCPVLELLEEVDIDAREIAELGDLGELAERADALEWMRQELSEERESKVLFRLWGEQGYSRNLWWRCRRKLGVEVKRIGNHPQQTTWLFIPTA